MQHKQEKAIKKAYTEVYTANTGLREPDVVTENATYYDGSSTNLGYMSTVTGDNTSYISTAKFKETLQKDYNKIVALIYNAGGYYVGRYETSNITTTKGTAINVVAGNKFRNGQYKLVLYVCTAKGLCSK